LGISSNHTQGSFSVSANAKGFQVLKSGTFELTQKLGSNVSLDFFLPQQQPNPSWFGAVQLYVDCPSKGINNAFVGQVELTGKTRNAFNHLTFPVSSTIANQVGNTCADFDFSLALNLPNEATGTYLIDNLQGIANTPTTPLPHGSSRYR